MTLLTIQIPDKDAEIVKKILEKFNVKILADKEKTPNKLTAKTIEEARKRENLSAPIKDINSFMKSL